MLAPFFHDNFCDKLKTNRPNNTIAYYASRHKQRKLNTMPFKIASRMDPTHMAKSIWKIGDVVWTLEDEGIFLHLFFGINGHIIGASELRSACKTHEPMDRAWCTPSSKVQCVSNVCYFIININSRYLTNSIALKRF